LLLLVVLGRLPGDFYLWPLSEWWVATPSIFIGLCIGLTLRFRSEGKARELGLVAGGAILAGLLGCAGARSEAEIAYAIGTVAVVAAFLVPKAAPVPGFAALADLTLGVYLIHPLVFLLLTKFLGAETTMLRVVAIYLGSLLATYAIRRLPFGKAIT
jgi:peptidoglycan/LPS O-acetylase OafA/YrhL